ncbi:MAG: DUF4157 domain-containing protein [Kofleriaceae bacterium]
MADIEDDRGQRRAAPPGLADASSQNHLQREPSPGKSTLLDHTAGGDPREPAIEPGKQPLIQLRARSRTRDPEAIHRTAAAGVAGTGGPLPYLDRIQSAFGHHDVSGVRAHFGAAATAAADQMVAEAYTTGNDVAFGSSSPSLHLAAHEAAHAVQQRGSVQLKGGVGEVGDAYEAHADAVADRVVQGHSAAALLDTMAPGTAASASGGVQHRLVQFDIKADLRDAMDGLGTDEDAIFRRIARGTLPELQSVLADRGLMAELRDELDQRDMANVLDGLGAPLADKLRLAMQGLGTDEGYIARSLQRASAAELAAIAADPKLLGQLESELSGDDLRAVFDRLPLSLGRRLEYAIRGLGTDEAYIYAALQRAPLPEVIAVATNPALRARVDADLSGRQLHRWRGMLAARLWAESPTVHGALAFQLCMGDDDDRTARLWWLGSTAARRALLDRVITSSAVAGEVIQAFRSYWSVETTVVEGATAWPIDVVRAIHVQMKALPSQDTRAGVWKELALTGDPALIDRAAWDGEALIVGANATTSDGQQMGHGTTLTTAAPAGTEKLVVTEPRRFKAAETVVIDPTLPSKKETVTISSIAGSEYALGTKLRYDHAARAPVVPDDATAFRTVNWLDATVRHEIGHAVETALGGVSGFTVGIGGWWTGDDFETWANAMGSPWTSPVDAKLVLTDDEKDEISDAITDCVTEAKGSLLKQKYATDHPIMKYWSKQIPVVVAAEQCLALGDRFHTQPAKLYSANGKRFSVSYWYKTFMYHHDTVVDTRVADYQLYAPAEFFAEAYTVFYEQAGKPGIADAQHGELIRDSTQRAWIRTNIHERGHAPTGTGGSTGPSAPAETVADDTGAKPGGAGFGKGARNPGP